MVNETTETIFSPVWIVSCKACDKKDWREKKHAYLNITDTEKEINRKMNKLLKHMRKKHRFDLEMLGFFSLLQKTPEMNLYDVK